MNNALAIPRRHILPWTPVQRVLVVEDYEPFRRVLCDLLQQRTDVRIVGEAADGPDAIRQAEALRPDVVMLDIGLPTTSGIEVADQLRAVVPQAKVVFVTNEASLEVVELASRTGAHGYVYKPRAQRDVLQVFDAILRGGRFVSGGLERVARGDSLASHRHGLVFYSREVELADAFSRFITGQLRDGNAVMVLVTEAHDASLRRSLHASGVDLALAISQERYIPVNISEMLEQVMVDGWPDRVRFLDAAEDLLAATARARGRYARLAACGECSPTLWANGQIEAAIQLEQLWDEFAIDHRIDILCAYPITAREESLRAVRSLCAEHTEVVIA